MQDGPVVIVGAGIAGLVCAIELQRAGREVVVVERHDDVGGRVRSRRVDGYTIDRGFQVLFTAYPTLTRYLALDALAPRRFAPGARIVTGDAPPALLGDALRALDAHDGALLGGTIAGVLTGRSLGPRDALRVLALRRLATSLSVDACFGPAYDGQTAGALLDAQGLSRRAIERFFVPFYGGILLDPTLSASASVLLFTLKMLAEGDTVVPAAGMGAIARQLAAQLAPGSVHTGATVARLTRDDDGVTGVQLADGTAWRASDVVLATEAPVAASLAAPVGVRLPAPAGALGSTTVWLASRMPALPGRAIWLDTAPAGARAVLHAVTMTEVAPEYAAPDAPHGRHLLAAVAVGDAAAWDDERLVATAIADVRRMAAAQGGPVPRLTAIDVSRVAYAQFPQPPGSVARRTSAETPLRGLWRASETAHTSSLEGAARGGALAADAVLAATGAAASR